MVDILQPTIDSFAQLWLGFLTALPKVVLALLVFMVGWLIAVALKNLIHQVLKAIKIDALLEQVGLGKALEKAGVKLDFGHWIGLIVKWFFIFVALMAATDILGWGRVSDYLKSVVDYIPQVLIAVVIIVVAVWAAGIMQKIIRAAVGAGQGKAGNFAGALAKWAILIFGLMAALTQLRVADGMISAIIQGFVYMVALAGGLAFGLGAKEQASAFIDKLKAEFSER